MQCAWDALLSILPGWMRQDTYRLGKEGLQELRIRTGSSPVLTINEKKIRLNNTVTQQDILFSVNSASQYSPWAAESMAKGYISCPGGHRMGLCGEAVIRSGKVTGIRDVQSLCIRVARDIPGCSSVIRNIRQSLLILGPPGSGKTTLLRDLIRRISGEQDMVVGVVDERGELFPRGVFDKGGNTDILTGCGKPEGLELILRTMGPEVIAVDEVTSEEDCTALIRASHCGVMLLATAHAGSVDDLMARPIYRALIKANVFENVVVLHKDKSIRTERLEKQ